MPRTSTIDRRPVRTHRHRGSGGGPSRVRSDHQRILDLQRTAGNRATVEAVQRSRQTAAETAVRQDLNDQADAIAAALARCDQLADPTVAADVAKIRGQLSMLRTHLAPGSDTDLFSVERALNRVCVQIQQEARRAARAAHDIGWVVERDVLIRVSNQAEAAHRGPRAALGTGPASARTGGQGVNDTAAERGGQAGAANDVLGGLGGGGVAIADVATKGTAAAGPVTGAANVVGGVAGGVGVLFGSIGLWLGQRATDRGRAAEKRLKGLVESGEITDDQVKELSAFAQEKKRKKKIGGKITSLVGVAGIGAGTLGLLALAIATLGIGAIVAGVGAALIGLGVVIGKWIHRLDKRNKFDRKIPGLATGMLDDGVAERSDGPIRRQVAAMGVSVDWDDVDSVNGSADALAAALRARVTSRRELVALSLLGYLTGPTSTAMFDAEKVIEALHLQPETLRRLVETGNSPTAQARIADKMASW